MEDIIKNKIEFQDMKNRVLKIKIELNGINGKLDITEEKISELELTETAFIQNEAQRKKNEKKSSRA